jgi:hypothetical protein
MPAAVAQRSCCGSAARSLHLSGRRVYLLLVERKQCSIGQWPETRPLVTAFGVKRRQHRGHLTSTPEVLYDVSALCELVRPRLVGPWGMYKPQ